MIGYDENNYGEYGGFSTPTVNTTKEEAAPEWVGNNLSGVAKIKVIGVGGAGNNAVDRLIESGLKCADYIVVNTDNQALARSKANKRIQIGVKLTKGLGAGSDPSIGKAAAEENKAEIQAVLKDTDLLFITAGMGGGTGTGAAPVIAKLAKDMKILTVGVVTLPFKFEAKRRMDNALDGVKELSQYVDAIITIPNDKIHQVVPKGTPFPEALKVADEVLRQGIRGIAELIVKPSLINLDFADVKTTLKGRGLAHMGIGVSKGDKRIPEAVRYAVCSPLLNTTIEGASSVILNVIGGKDLSLDEVVEAADLVRGVIDYSANVIFGACIDENMSDEVEVVIIATGFGAHTAAANFESQPASSQQVENLSKRLENLYNEKRYTTPQTPTGYSMPNTPSNAQPNGGMPMGGQPMNGMNPMGGQPMNGMNGQAAYPGAYGQQPYAMPTQQGYMPTGAAFEPNDPIPDETPMPSQPIDRKHKPRFADRFFMRNNPNNK